MGRIGKPQKSKKHKKLKPVASEYLDLWQDKKARNGAGAARRDSREKPQHQKINSVPKKPNDQEMPRRLLEVLKSKEKMKMKKTKKRKKKHDMLTNEVTYKERHQKGMTRPVEATPQFVRYKYETDQDFIKRVETMTKNYVERVRFEVQNEIVKPEDDPILKDHNDDPEHEEKMSEEAGGREKPSTKMVKLENVKSSKSTKKKHKAVVKKNATGFERFRDPVKFGEVAMEPPSFKAKPRQAKQGEKKVPRDLLLMKKFSSAKTHPEHGAPVGRKADHAQGASRGGKADLTARRRDLPLATRRKLDNERDRVVEMYRAMKQKKLEAQIT